MLDGFRLPQMLHVVARLGIADAVGQDIDDARISTGEIATRIGAHPDSVRRLLRALAMVGVFVQRDGDAWGHSPLSVPLCSGHPSCLGDRAIVLGTLAWGPWGELRRCVQTGEPAFEHVFGEAFFEHLKSNPHKAASFGRTMTSFTRGVARAVNEVVDWSAYSHVVDVGGGHGAFLDEVLAATPGLDATLVDRPEVAADEAPQVRTAVRERLSCAGADFFADALPVGDAYLLSWVLHDWNDDACRSILRACLDANARADILVVEMLVEDGPCPAKMFDIEMLVQTGGRERTREEYSALLSSAGAGLKRCLATAAPHSVLVAGASR